MTIDINDYMLKSTDGTYYTLPTYLEGIDDLTRFMRKVIYEKDLYFTFYSTVSGKLSKTVSSIGKHLYRLPGYCQ